MNVCECVAFCREKLPVHSEMSGAVRVFVCCAHSYLDVDVIQGQADSGEHLRARVYVCACMCACARLCVCVHGCVERHSRKSWQRAL